MKKYGLWIALITTLMFGCNSQTDDLPTPVKPIPEKPAAPPKESPRPAPVVPKEVPLPAPAPVKLELQEHTLKHWLNPKTPLCMTKLPPSRPRRQKRIKRSMSVAVY